jgi:hypothetical protein
VYDTVLFLQKNLPHHLAPPAHVLCGSSECVALQFNTMIA